MLKIFWAYYSFCDSLMDVNLSGDFKSVIETSQQKYLLEASILSSFSSSANCL